jgi:hypothetical protein
VNDTPPNGNPNLDDPEWVDKILARARKRAAQPEPVTTSPVGRPAATPPDSTVPPRPTFTAPAYPPVTNTAPGGSDAAQGGSALPPSRDGASASVVTVDPDAEDS